MSVQLKHRMQKGNNGIFNMFGNHSEFLLFLLTHMLDYYVVTFGRKINALSSQMKRLVSNEDFSSHKDHQAVGTESPPQRSW